MAASINIVNAEHVSKTFGTRVVLDDLSLGLSSGEVIGVVGGSIGERLYESKVYFQTADLLAWTVVIVVCSVGFEKLVLWLLRRCFAAWEGR